MSRADQVTKFKADRKKLLDNGAHRGPGNTVTYYFSNDEEFSTVVFPLLLSSTVENVTDKMRVALVVGQSHLPSILPELQNCCDLLLVVDYHKPCLNWVNTMINQLRKQQTLPAYQQILKRIHNTDAQIPERRATFPSFNERIQNERAKLPKKHFTDRFSVVKKSADELPVDFVLMDLTNENKIQALLQLLTGNNAEISFLNISNIVDYASCAQVVHHVSLLPFSDNPIIVTSESKPKPMITPVCCQVFRSTKALQSKYLENSYIPHYCKKETSDKMTSEIQRLQAAILLLLPPPLLPAFRINLVPTGTGSAAVSYLFCSESDEKQHTEKVAQLVGRLFEMGAHRVEDKLMQKCVRDVWEAMEPETETNAPAHR